MNNEHYPDKWNILRINKDDYRVFGAWSGGYLSGDSWRVNSGITRVEDDGKFYKIHGKSGSVYFCHKRMQGVTNAYCYGQMKAGETKGVWKILSREDAEKYLRKLIAGESNESPS